MSRLEDVILVWFALSIFTEVVSAAILRIWLSRRGVRVRFYLYGVPGYLERVYRNWRRSQGRPSNTVFILRIISLVNVIVAAIVAIPIIARS